ncbi:hypothetical protein VP01_1690g5 [Puccinia sorghi]|uniref:Uncharacterized protein n=1 Tax=Puccinia sorghi TaxID=27349 RepID=A0A0L6VFX1_9BASI|nr:hypothetical protein VP01_1690g5 [Puccinia sorghi]
MASFSDFKVSAIVSTQASPQSSKYNCLHHDKQYLTVRGNTTRFHPQYNLSSIQSLSESCFQQLFRMSWPCFLNFLHLIKPDPIFYNQYQIINDSCSQTQNLFQFGYRTINLYTTQEQVELSQVMPEEGFPGCISFVDGETIHFIKKPPIDGVSYVYETWGIQWISQVLSLC